MTSRPRVSMRIAEPSASITSIDSVFVELPRPRREGVGLRGERADRAEIDHVALQLRGHRLLEIGGDLHVLAAADGAELRHAGDLGHEADAARAVDAARHDGLDQRADILVLDRALVLLVAAGVDAVGHRLVLQVAFAALVADRAVERMVDQQELHHAFARLLHHRRAGADDLAACRRGSGGSRARPGAGRQRLRRADQLDQAHAAVAGDRQPLVEAEARDFRARGLAGLEQRVLRRDVDLLPSTMSLVIASYLAHRFEAPCQMPERHRREQGQHRIDREQHRCRRWNCGPA